MPDNVRSPVYQVIVRLPIDAADRLDKLTEMYVKRSLLKGVKIGKATVGREALLLGLPLLEKKFAKEATKDEK
jgi:hypothetical protein